MSKILEYVPQPDEITCQAACCAQAIGSTDVGSVRRQLRALGSPGDPDVMAAYLRPRVNSYVLSKKASINDAVSFFRGARKGRMVIVHGWFTPPGHVISLRGVNDKPESGLPGFMVDDPYAEFNFPGWRFSRQLSGNNVRYSYLGIYAACVAGSDHLDAHNRYGAGELDEDLGLAWMHFIRN